jgi:hypothetical protein
LSCINPRIFEVLCDHSNYSSLMGTVAINLVTYFFEKCFEWFFAFFPWDLQVRPTQRGPTVISSETPSSDATLYDGRGWRNLGETTENGVVAKAKKKKKS